MSGEVRRARREVRGRKMVGHDDQAEDRAILIVRRARTWEGPSERRSKPARTPSRLTIRVLLQGGEDGRLCLTHREVESGGRGGRV